MRSVFQSLDFFDDAEPHSAAFNMATDEVLLAQIARPMLRVYRWARPAVSFGYFEKWEPVKLAHPQRELVRRWTGGGVVLHGAGEDWTYSLLAPEKSEFTQLDATGSYRAVHDAIVFALRRCGVGAEVAKKTETKISQACFENAVRHDVLLDGKKIAGAAQRRTRSGLLHQGSIQGVQPPEDFGATLASALARCIEKWTGDAMFAEFVIPMEKKYVSREWLERR